MLMLAAAVSASAEDAVYVVPFTCTPGETVTAKIAIANDSPLGGPSFDIHLPKGFSFAYTSKNKKPICTVLNNDRTAEEGEVFAFTQSSINPKVDTDGHNYASVAFSGEWDVYGTDGELFSSAIKADPSVEPGVYPIYITNYFYCSNEDLSQKHFLYEHVYTSYIVVGNGGVGSVALNGEISKTVNAALATEAAVKTLDLSKVTASYGDFTYVDSRNVVAPADVTASVKYEGDKTGYYSVNVPFGADVTGEVYEFASASGGYAHFDKVTTVEANKTYLAKGKVTIAANAKVVGVAEKTGQTGNYVLDATFYHGTNLTVPATRGLFEGASLSNLRVVVDGVLTNINVAQIEAGEASYDLQGRQTTNTKNGVFVVNGKKQFVK